MSPLIMIFGAGFFFRAAREPRDGWGVAAGGATVLLVIQALPLAHDLMDRAACTSIIRLIFPPLHRHGP